MKTMLVSALALGAMTSVAFAGELSSKATPAKAAPVPLTEVQMDAVTAGNGDTNVGVCVVCAQASIAAALQLLTANSAAMATTGNQNLRIGTGG